MAELDDSAGIAREELKHIRAMHFSVLLVAGTLLYLTYTIRSDVDRFAEELTSFRSFLTHLNGLAENPNYFYDVRPDQAERYERELKPRICRHLSACSPSQVELGRSDPEFFFFQVRPFKFRFSIHETFDEFLQKTGPDGRLTVYRVSSLDGNWTDVNAWLKQQGVKAGDGRYTVVLGFKPDSGHLNAKGGEGSLVVDLVRGKKRSSVRETVSTASFPVQWEATDGGEQPCISEHILARRYPTIWGYLGDIKKHSIGGEAKWYREYIQKPLEEVTPSLFGLQITEKYVALVGTVVILCQLFYLCAYLGSVDAFAKCPQRNIQLGVSPWVGTMPGCLPKCIALFTLVVLPTGAICYASREAAGIGLGWTVLTTLLGFLLSVACLLRAGDIRKHIT